MRLGSRELVPELMDAPDLDPQLHRQALAGLRRINWFSRTSKRIADEVMRIAKANRSSSIRVLDLGCGSGDVAIDVASRIALHTSCSVTGWDMSPTAVETANRNAASRRPTATSGPQIHFEVANVFSIADSETDQSQRFDIVYCSLFLHHFTASQAVDILTVMQRLARLGVIIDDLCRTPFGLFLATTGCQLLSRSPIVHFDGPQSVRAAFTLREMQCLAEQARLVPCRLIKRWPERFLFVWERESA